jgi:glycosyltransferase involved in cell wall biosynthesis
VRPRRHRRGRGAKARKKLGLAEEEVAIAAPGAPGQRSGHRLAVWATAILAVAEAPVRVVIQETGQAARKVAKFARQAGFAEQTILAAPQVSLPEILAAADVAVFLAPDGMPPVHLASAMSAGLPIVAAETSAAGQWLTFGRNALPAAPEDPRDIARALLRLIEDRELAGRLGRSARRTAGRRFHPRSIREQWAEVYADVSAARPCPAG